jgi:hypothetical protein
MHNKVIGSELLQISPITSNAPRVPIEASIEPAKFPADQYSGVLYGKVGDVADLVVMPFTFNVRTGPLSASWWLLYGLSLGFFVQWMDAKGHPQSALLIRADRVRRELTRHDAAILERALDAVRDLAYRFELVVAQMKMGEIEQRAPKLRQLTAIEQDLYPRRKEEAVQAILDCIDRARIHYQYEDDSAAGTEVSAIIEAIANLPRAEGNKNAELARNTKDLERALARPASDQTSVRWNAARWRLRYWLGIARADFIRFIMRPLLWLGLVAALLYIGMYLFWVKNPSFGAQPLADNISLILWGLSANVASAKLSSLPTLVR